MTPKVFPKTGLVRLKDIIRPNGPIPVSKSTWWKGVLDGRFPKHHEKFADRITVWRDEDIQKLFKSELEKSL